MEIKKRTIMIFPEFNNMYLIETIRNKYDPLFKKVKPHITLVFPFESRYTTQEITDILEKRLQKVSAFNVVLKGVSASDVWMSLDIMEGKQEIIQIHKDLYKNEFSDFKPAWLSDYVPHITVGHFHTKEELLKAFEAERNMSEGFTCLVDKISVEIIGENDESIIEVEQSLKDKNEYKNEYTDN